MITSSHFNQASYIYHSYSTLILGTLALIIAIILSIFAYIKITFRFWSLQPVFHVYDLWYYIMPPGIIRNELPERNKYCNDTNIVFTPFTSTEKTNIDAYLHLIKKCYLQNGENQFLPTKENMVSYFTGHNSTTFLSLYYEDEILVDSKEGDTVKRKRLIGGMTTRPLRITINNGKKDAFFDCYYVDYLCVDTEYRKKGIAQQLIQTHEYHQRRQNQQVQVSLFKREGTLTGIVPLCVYNLYGYNLATWKKPAPLDPRLSLIEVGPTNIQHALDFMKSPKVQKKFDITIVPDLANLLELLKVKAIYIYMILKDHEVQAVYFFRKSCTYIKKGVEVVTLYASINNSGSQTIFARGYINALWKLCTGTDFQFAGIEDIADNGEIIESIKVKPDLTTPCAYFFYNFAYPTFSSKKTLILT